MRDKLKTGIIAHTYIQTDRRLKLLLDRKRPASMDKQGTLSEKQMQGVRFDLPNYKQLAQQVVTVLFLEVLSIIDIEYERQGRKLAASQQRN